MTHCCVQVSDEISASLALRVKLGRAGISLIDENPPRPLRRCFFFSARSPINPVRNVSARIQNINTRCISLLRCSLPSVCSFGLIQADTLWDDRIRQHPQNRQGPHGWQGPQTNQWLSDGFIYFSVEQMVVM